MILVEHALFLVESWEIVDVIDCCRLVACEEVVPVFDLGRDWVGSDQVVGGCIASDSETTN